MNVKVSVKKLYQMELRYELKYEAAEKFHEKEIKLLEQRNDALEAEVKRLRSQTLDDASHLSNQWSAQEKTTNWLTDENERLKNLFEDKVQSHLQQLAEINELKLEVEWLKSEQERLEQQLDTANARGHKQALVHETFAKQIEALKRMTHPAQMEDES